MTPKAFCSLFILSLAAGHAAAQTYVVGVEQAAFAPHYKVDAHGEYQGFARELLDLFARDSGVQVTYRPLPVAELQQALLNGSIDLKYPDSPEWAGPAKAGRALYYSRPVVHYVDGVLVAPRRVGQGVDKLERLALVEGWTPTAYRERIASGQTVLVHSADLRQMIRQALHKDSDGAYYNVVVATHYLDHIRARPGALVFDPALPHTRGSFHLASMRHPALIERFDRFLAERHDAIAALKQAHGVEANLDSEFLGMEQWKIDFLKRQQARQATGAP